VNGTVSPGHAAGQHAGAAMAAEAAGGGRAWPSRTRKVTNECAGHARPHYNGLQIGISVLLFGHECPPRVPTPRPRIR
jgi:hypothetical protein